MKAAFPSRKSTSSEPMSLPKTIDQSVTRRQSNQSTSSTDSFSTVSSRGGPSSFSPGSPTNKDVSAMYAVELDVSKPVPASAITYELVTRVIDSWEQGIKRIQNWESVVGETLARKVLENDPDTTVHFGVPANTQPQDPVLSTNKVFIAKARQLIAAIDATISTLGPDLGLLERQSLEMGDQMSSMNCHPYQWSLAGKAFLHVLQDFLGDDFTTEHRESWTIIYNFSSYHMVSRLLKRRPSLALVASSPEGSESQTKVLISKRRSSTSRVVSLDCTRPVSADDITFDMVTDVLTSWEKGIRNIPNWSSKLGLLFMRYIFKHTGGEGKRVMGYPEDVAWDDPALSTDPIFQKKGIRLIQAIDMAIGFLGPDLSPLEMTMFDLGRRHYHMNCKPEHWPLVGEALFDVFRDFMGENGADFTYEVEEAWTLIYNFLGYHMIQGLLAEKNDVL